MAYSKLEGTIENSLKQFSGKDYYSWKELSDDLFRQWEQLLSQQSGYTLPLLRNSSILLSGITVDMVMDRNAFFLLKILRLVPKKMVFRFAYEDIRESLLGLLQNADYVEKEFVSLSDKINELKDEILKLKSQKYSSSPNGTEKITESRFFSLAGSFQRVMMDAMVMPDEKWYTVIKNDVKAALHRHGMDIIDYNEANKHFFETQEDEDCQEITMVYPAIIRLDDEMIIAKGKVFLPQN